MGSTTKLIWSNIQFLVFHGAGRYAVKQPPYNFLVPDTLIS